MDKWKRNGNTLYNDDSLGYENALKRINKQKEKKNKELEDIKFKEDFADIKKKVDIMWQYLQMANILPKNNL